MLRHPPDPSTAERHQVGLLAGLTGLHLVADMFPGMMPALLPALRDNFRISLAAGIVLLSAMNIVVNGMQVATGHLRGSRDRPLFMPVCFVLTGAFGLLCLVPVGPAALPLLGALLVVGGAGVAVYHPECMRAVHSLTGLASSVKTPIIMMGGWLGFCGGPWLGSALVQQWGLRGLLLLLPLSPLCLVLVLAMRFRLAVEAAPSGNGARAAGAGAVAFWPLFAMAVPVATAMTIVTTLLPTHLNLLGRDLASGGFACFVFGAASGTGGVLWGLVARRRGELPTSSLCLLAGVPAFAAYLLLARHSAAVLLLIPCGLLLGGGYPMLVSKARDAVGPNLGARMALMMGGVWGIASILMMFLSPLAGYAERSFGSLACLLHLAWILYAAAGIYGLWLARLAGHSGGAVASGPPLASGSPGA